MAPLKTDYLIIGCGAVGMAFADVILSETDADIIIVDKHHKPGGHWNDAYSFVTLHQPSAFYGVSSWELSKGRIDQVGLNKGLNELASGAEVSSYFDQVMRHQFLPTGRVRYFPMSEWREDGRVVSLTSGDEFTVEAKKTVDATFYRTSVPATHTPNFSVAEGVRFHPLNDLPHLATSPADYVIVGGGKTAIDAVLWLLEQRVDPDRIQWIRPREGWLFDRGTTQPGVDFFEATLGNQAAQMECIAAAAGVEDLFDRLEAAGCLTRLDPDVRPTMFHGATISQAEIAELARVKNVVRMGHVQEIQKSQIILKDGMIPTTPDTIHIDCSARAVELRNPVPVFQGDLITLQTVRLVQPAFSAALIAHVEAAYETEKEKNRLTAVVPLPNNHTDWIKANAASMMNQFTWGQDKALRAWMTDNRLDGFSKMVREVDKDDEAKMAILTRMKEAAQPAMQNMFRLLKEVNAA